MFPRLALFVLLSLGLIARAAEPDVQLLLPSRKLEPKSTFELRFASEMVPPEQIGKVAPVSPLLIEPPVAGQFVWLSRRSGSFAPAGILPLGTKFQIAIAPGLKDASGKPLGAKFRELAETPPMRVKGVYQIGRRDTENASIVPTFLVLFNANVRADAAAKFIRFEDAARNRIPACVEQANDPAKREWQFPRWESDDRSLDGWSAQPGAAEPEQPEAGGEEGDPFEVKKPGAARDNVLFVAPVKPLPPGKGWRLVIDAGVPAAEWKAALPLAHQVPLGVVQPFAVKEIAAEANRIAGRRLLIEFTKSLAEGTSAETMSRWVKVEPAPPGMKMIVEDSSVSVRGEFALGQRYRVTVAPGVPAQEPTETTAPFTKEFTFEKYDPRLYFQDFAAHQYAGGTRELRLVAVNVPRLRVSAKLFRGDEVAAAVKAYDAYEQAPEAEANEAYTRVDVDALPGTVIWQ
ncbi:MAG TPA: hypothetical protein VF551_09055, partial [Chthoniobacterales bacterium]